MSPDDPNYALAIERAAQNVIREVFGSVGKFPLNRHMHAALGEEVGEIAEALLEHDRGTKTSLDVYTEAMQVAAMALRIAIEGSQEFPYRYEVDDSLVFRPTGAPKKQPKVPASILIPDVGC